MIRRWVEFLLGSIGLLAFWAVMATLMGNL